MLSIQDEVENGKSNGIWKKEMMEAILIADSNTAILRPPMDSDPWVDMIDDFGELPEDYDNIRDDWTEDMENSFQSVASSNKEQFQIFENETGKVATISKNDVIAKFREDRLRNKFTFTLKEDQME